MHVSKKDSKYDLIVIGSGIGSLTTAALMAKLKNWRVLVLERHKIAGGCTHGFKRIGGYEWDVGVHYVGLMQPGSNERRLFDFITDGLLDWKRISEPFDVFEYPDFTLNVFSAEQEQCNQLLALFPKEKPAILKYYKDLKAAESWGVTNFIAATLPTPFAKLTRFVIARKRKLALLTTQEYIDNSFSDEKLKAIIASQWQAHGLPPSRSAFGLHAAVVRHYFQGGYFPKGGAGEIAKHTTKVIRECGGVIKIGHEVTKIILSDGEAVGVCVKTKRKGKDVELSFHAPNIVSGIGLLSTLKDLLESDQHQEKIKKLTQISHHIPSAVSLFIGFKQSPEKLGFRGENHWLYNSFDHEENIMGTELLNGSIKAGHLSFPSLKGAPNKKHTAEYFSIVDYNLFEKWKDTQFKHRKPDYEKLKETITETILSDIEKRHPGFRDIIEYTELATPLSVEHYLGHSQGAIYGLPATPEKFRQNWIKAISPIPNLYFTGVDLLCVGVVPGLLSGAATAGALLGPFGFLKVMMTATKKPRLKSISDNPDHYLSK